MDLTFCPLLGVQQELYALPHGSERFAAYLRTLLDATGQDLGLPLAEMNPMGRDHVPALIGDYLALGAEELAAKTVSEMVLRTTAAGGRFRVGLVVVDDAQGRWTNRATAEFNHLFHEEGLWQRGWLAAHLWTSEPASAERVLTEVRAVVYRAVYRAEHGAAHSLREILAQEGHVQAQAGAPSAGLPPAELERTRRILEPHLAATDLPTILSALFGDAAAAELGYRRLGLGFRAGLTLAQATAQRSLRRH